MFSSREEEASQIRQLKSDLQKERDLREQAQQKLV
jgi:hypothetical protein